MYGPVVDVNMTSHEYGDCTSACAISLRPFVKSNISGLILYHPTPLTDNGVMQLVTPQAVVYK